jgi:glutamyl-tRNA synthetase
LGWNDGTDKEIYSLEELVEAFDLTRVHKAGAKFDPEKINGSITIFNQAKDEDLAKSLRYCLRVKGRSPLSE